MKARKRRDMLRQREDMEVRLAAIRAKEKAQKERYIKGDQGFKKRKVDSIQGELDDEEQFVLDDYESDGESGSNRSQAHGLYSAETLALMEKLGMGKSTTEPEEDEIEETKVTDSLLAVQKSD